MVEIVLRIRRVKPGKEISTRVIRGSVECHRTLEMYVNRNARLPIATSVALAFGSIVGGAFLVEVVFSYPGIGYMLYEAVTTSDFPLIDGIFLIITITVIIANFIVDLLYAFLDPRVVLE